MNDLIQSFDSSTDVAELIRTVDRLGLMDECRCRSFMAWCCRQVWDWIPDSARPAVLVAERIANGEIVPDEEMVAAAKSAAAAAAVADIHWLFAVIAYAAKAAAVAGSVFLTDDDDCSGAISAAEFAVLSVRFFANKEGFVVPAMSAARSAQCHKIRELWGDDVREKIRAAFAEGAS